MDATTTTNSAWSTGLDKLLTTGSTIFTGITNAQTAKEQAKAAQAAQKAAAANAAVTQQSNKMKYYLIGGGVLIAGLVAFLIFWKKK